MKRLVYIVIHGLSDNFYEIDSAWSDEKTARKRCNDLNKKLQENPEFGVGLYEVRQEIVKPRGLYKK